MESFHRADLTFDFSFLQYVSIPCAAALFRSDMEDAAVNDAARLTWVKYEKNQPGWDEAASRDIIFIGVDR